jgi:hypothetical protein
MLAVDGMVMELPPPWLIKMSLRVFEALIDERFVEKKLATGETAGDSIATETGVVLRLRERRESRPPPLPLFLLAVEGIVFRVELMTKEILSSTVKAVRC